MNNFYKLILIAIMALACFNLKAMTGKATLTGKFLGSFPIEKTFSVKIAVPNLVEGASRQFDEYETQLETDGSFSLLIPLFSPVYAMLTINDENLGAFFLSPDKETKIDLSLTNTNKIQAKVIEGQELTIDDLEKINEPFMKFGLKLRDPLNSLSELRWNMAPDEYKNYILQWTDKQIAAIVDENKNLSDNLKQLLHGDLKWKTFTGYLFNYEDITRGLYEKGKNNNTTFIPIKPNKTYYSFLNYFDWNNPPVFNDPAYSIMFKRILIDSILNIPDLEKNQSLVNWLKEVKMTLNPLIGYDSGMFYDMLALHAYMKQLDEDLKPLSIRQIEDIKTYFKNPTFAKYLFVKNEALMKHITQTKFPSIIKETPVVDKENLMDAIVSSYKGKVVVVDFWATWCVPCLESIKLFKPLKEDFFNENVVFVYITDESSPKELWKKKIQDITGEHYYLTKEESKSISNSKQYSFDKIPTYMFFDSNGVLKNKISGYPGNEEMRKMIEKLLP